MDNPDLQARLMKTFLVEMEDHVATLNEALLQLEKETSAERRSELVQLPFRAAHSLKGAARSVGQTALEGCCQYLESVFAVARSDGSIFDDQLFRLLYGTTDAIEALGKALAQGEAVARPDAELERLAQRLLAVAAKHSQALGEPLAMAGKGPGDATPPPFEASVAGRAARPEAALGQHDGPADEGPGARARPAAAAAQDGWGLSGHVRVSGNKLDSLLVMSGELHVARMRGQLQSNDIDHLKSFVQGWREDWSRAFPLLTKLAGEVDDGAASAPAGGRKTRQALRVLAETNEKLERLDRDLERLRRQHLARWKELESAAMPIERELRQIRMLPFQQACDGLHRAVRDLASSRDRQVALTIEGGELELDRSILEKMRSPLLQLVRNAIDHGIEAVGEREAAGKSPQGQIVVSAAIEGNRAHICVADDGRGLDLQAVAERSRVEGLAIPSDPEALADLIFEPGVSTAQAITALSGRGVGLDVVKTTVTALRGTVGVTSRPGEGTRFDISLPLTLSAFSALLMRVGKTSFAIDLENILRVVPVDAGDIVSADGRNILVLQGRQVPVVFLADLLRLGGEPSATEAKENPIAVVLVDGERQVAFLVDQVIGNQEIVVKPLGERLRQVRYVSGGSVLPDGDLALILNASELIAGSFALAPSRVSADALKGSLRTPKRLLVVEDSMTTRMLVVSVLEASGYAVEAAADGVDAWAILEAMEVDLVVSDVEMPRMDGIDLTEKIRKTPRTRDIPIILLTARETEDDRLRGLQAGADAYLVKSAFDQTALLDTIQRLLP
jgi:two-component system chemotaxis sensor kinase CheA